LSTGAIIGLAGTAVLGILFAWAATRWRATAARVGAAESEAKTAHRDNAVLREVIAEKEVKLVETEKALVAHLPAKSVVAGLNGLFPRAATKPGRPLARIKPKAK
jgi:hypothetical protein